MSAPPDRIIRREVVYRTDWFELIAKTTKAAAPGGPADVYFAMASTDYVTVLPVTRAGEVVFVRQFRPAVEAVTLELPSGHVDPGESAEVTARRELREETGYEAQHVEFLATLYADTGRRENRLWCYLARDVVKVSSSELEVVLLPGTALITGVAEGNICHALDVAVIGSALARYGPPLFGGRPPTEDHL